MEKSLTLKSGRWIGAINIFIIIRCSTPEKRALFSLSHSSDVSRPSVVGGEVEKGKLDVKIAKAVSMEQRPMWSERTLCDRKIERDGDQVSLAEANIIFKKYPLEGVRRWSGVW